MPSFLLPSLATTGETGQPVVQPVVDSPQLEVGWVEATTHRSAQICFELRLVLSGSVCFCDSFICGKVDAVDDGCL